MPFAIQSEMNPIFRPFCNFMSLVRIVFLSFSRIFFKIYSNMRHKFLQTQVEFEFGSVFFVLINSRLEFDVCSVVCMSVVFNFMLLPSDFHILYGKNDIQQWHVLGECERAAIIPRHHYHYHHHHLHHQQQKESSKLSSTNH